MCLARGNMGTAVNIGACGSPKAADLMASPGPGQESAETLATSDARTAGGDAEWAELRLERPNLAGHRLSPIAMFKGRRPEPLANISRPPDRLPR